MKTNEIKNIIDKTLLETVKEVLLSEQNNTVDKINIFNEQNTSLNRLPSLSCFKEHITNVKNVSQNPKDGVIINIINVDANKFVKCCEATDIREAQSNLIKSLHNNLDNSGLYIDQLSSFEDEQLGTSNDYDIDINIVSVGNNLNIQIKIILGEKLGEEMKENTKIKKAAPCECDKKQKKVVSLGESELLNMIKKIVVESELVPGLSVTKDVTKTAGTQNSEYMTSVDKKMKDYLKFNGNSNPEFPNQNKGEKKVGYEKTSEDDDYVDNNRGGGLQDYDYDTEPSDAFVDRVKKALTGDSTMGNSSELGETANTIKTKTGEEILKKVEKKKKAEKKQPMYVKDPQPVEDVKKDEKTNTVKESKEEAEKKKIIQEDIQRMKQMYNYGEKRK